MEPAVSILIPAFNCEKYIRWTIESALAQTWPKKEIIVVDDGSSDNTFWIARQFESNSVKVIKQDNMGASAARNKALGLAQGDYIQWLDADDILHPDKIRLQIKKMIQENDDSVLLSSSWGKFYYRTEKAKFLPNRLWQDLDPVDWLVIKFLENLYMISSSWLVSRVLTNLAGPWNEKLSLDDDGEYICRIVASSKRIVVEPRRRGIRRSSRNGRNKLEISVRSRDFGAQQRFSFEKYSK
jgi:glycosyltransferase involved in cell wall biosynthesis